MAGFDHGALGATFKTVRVLQAMSLIAIIGMTASFISQIVTASAAPPKVLVGTISVTCVSAMYCATTFILFLDGILPFLINAGMDALLLIAVIVVAVVAGKPLSYLDCNVIGKITGSNSSAYAFTAALANRLDKEGEDLSYRYWIGASKSNCLEMKSIWGLSIALCILFAFSGICSVCLWRQTKMESPKDIEE